MTPVILTVLPTVLWAGAAQALPTTSSTPAAPAPASPTAATTADPDAFRATQPPPGPPSVFSVPEPERFVAGGLDVFLVERHDLPVVTTTVAWSTGAAADPTKKAGLASLCTALLGEGSTRLSKVAFEEAQSDLAAQITFGSGAEQTTAALRTIKPSYARAFDLLVETIATPGLRPEDLERVRARAIAHVAQQKGSAESIAHRLQGRVLWGDGHPLGAVTTEASLRAITAADCAAFVQHLGPKGARLFVVGDVTKAEVLALVDESQRQHRWRGSAPAPVNVPPPKNKTGGVVVVDVPGAQQSMVLVLAEGPARTARDYEAQSVMLAILGGGFSSRINMNLREKHGYTYGARAGVAYTRTRGVFSASSSVRTDVTGPALREIAAELKAMATGEVSDEELARERDGALQSFPARFATGAAIADAWHTVAFHGLPKNTWEKMPSRLYAVDKPAIAAATKTALPKKLTVLVVGDMAKVGADVDAIAAEGLFGEATKVVRLDADGVPVAP